MSDNEEPALNDNHDNAAPPAPPNLRSGPSLIHALVRFINTTHRSVDVIWINFDGLAVLYGTLGPEQTLIIDTFVGHPWIFQDTLTGDRLCVDEQREVYEPVRCDEEEDRKQVYIVNQLTSLRSRCLQEVRRIMPYSLLATLQLPGVLMRDLHAPQKKMVIETVYEYD